MSKFETTSYDEVKTILRYNDFLAAPVHVDDDGISANEDGKKIVKAGTIVGGKTKPWLSDHEEEVVEKNDPGEYASAELEIDGTPEADLYVVVTALEPGTELNGLKVELRDPSANDQDLEVVIYGDTIVVSLATGSTGAITSTAKNVVDAINAHFAASKLVHAEAVGELDPATTTAIAVAATELEGGDDGDAFEAEGVLLHDVDVTHGDAVGQMILWGFIDANKLEDEPCEEAKAVLAGRILFCK